MSQHISQFDSQLSNSDSGHESADIGLIARAEVVRDDNVDLRAEVDVLLVTTNDRYVSYKLSVYIKIAFANLFTHYVSNII